MNHRVLVVEDNADMRNALIRFLESNGFVVTAVDSTEDGIDAVDEHKFDIALIDINLPGKSGFSMIEYIREKGEEMPLIAMTARDGLSDKLSGFKLGLTDYVVKPFDLKELLARILVHLKATNSSNTEIQIGRFKINPLSWEFFINNKIVTLTKTEFRLMHCLMMHNKMVVTLDTIAEFVWGNGPESYNPPIRIHLANLRRKIGDSDCTIIQTIPGIGYKLNESSTSN